MKKVGLTVIILAALAIAGVVLHNYITTPKEEGIAHLKPVKLTMNSKLNRYSSSFSVREKKRPEGLINLPNEIDPNSANLYFFTSTIGSHRVFSVIRLLSDKKALAWIDTNIDRNLSDEKAIPGILKKFDNHYKYFDFGTTHIASKNINTAQFHLSCDKTGVLLTIRPTQYRLGRIKLNGAVYYIAAVDGDFDGKFTTLYKPTPNYRYAACDVIAIDLNRTGRFFRQDFDGNEIVPLGRYFKREIDKEQFYGVTISEDGCTIQLQNAPPEFGTLAIHKNKRLSTQFFSDAATQWVRLKNEIKLPIGNYQIHYGELRYEDNAGRTWDLRPDFHEDIRKGQFTITPGQTITLNPGPPFAIKTDIRKKNNDTLSINAGLVGNEGEEYGLLVSQDMPRPILKIIDENNKEIHAGRMEFG